MEGLIRHVAQEVAALLRPELERLGVCSSSVSQRLLSVPEAAVYLGRSVHSIRHMTSDGTLPVVRHDKRVFLDRRDLDEWIDRAKM